MLTIEMDSALENALEATAQQHGMTAENYVRELVRQDIEIRKEADSEVEAARKKAITQLRGKFPSDGHDVDRFLAERRAEAEMEIRQAEEREKWSKQ